MTTKDIAKAQIYFIGKGGEILIGETADPITLQFIASTVQFRHSRRKQVCNDGTKRHRKANVRQTENATGRDKSSLVSNYTPNEKKRPKTRI